MSFAWKDEHMETILEMYQTHECLWNNMSENYHKTNIRKKAYKTLHSELNLPQLSVNNKRAEIKTIRNRYCSELAKIRKSEKSGAGSNDLDVLHLFWFKQADSFLRDVCSPKDSSSNMQVSSNVLKFYYTVSLVDIHFASIKKTKLNHVPLPRYNVGCHKHISIKIAHFSCISHVVITG
jgi:hypothetical protein